MSLKIMHTGDVHLGMKFAQYPSVSRDLEEARYLALENVVEEANQRYCNLLVIAGDLYDKTNIKDEDILRTISILDKFSGDTVLILPGNHDYHDGVIDLWKRFKENLTGKMLLLDEEKPYDMRAFDLDAAVYPAPCDSRHSADNNLGWIKEIGPDKERKYNIGLAHGALAGFSPDLTDSYFKMTEEELLELEMDLWLLGHSHIAYPKAEKVKDRRIFNSGTPEPDGMDCRHRGYAWYIELEAEQENTKISAERIITGNYHFEDRTDNISGEAELKKIVSQISSDSPQTKILRLKLKGSVSKELISIKEKYLEKIRANTFHSIIDQSALRLKIDKDMIAEDFAEASFPNQLLNELVDNEEAVQLAYDLLKEVQQ